jgi:Na+:H+ antiporter, NhaA family
MTHTETMLTAEDRQGGAFQLFFRQITQGSYPLFLAAVAALAWANLDAYSYHALWHTELSVGLGPFLLTKTLAHWIDEALMAVFFFVVGLEIKRELLVGGLSSPRQAILPVAAAIGGMAVPALIFLAFNAGTVAAKGWGIPMATDIAFALAVLSLLGDRAPLGLKLFLSALAIADDLGAVLVIALFYTPVIHAGYLLAAIAILGILLAGNLMWIRWTLFYAVCGVALWFAVLGSGIHATVAGVVVALFIPARGKFDTDTFVRNVRHHLDRLSCEDESCGFSILLNRNHLNSVQAIDLCCKNVETPLQRLEHALQPWVAYLVLTLFALANAGLHLGGLDWAGALGDPVTQGVALGLTLGKPLGVVGFSFMATRWFKAQLPSGVGWADILGAGLLSGIGFTMSLFVTGLSFSSPEMAENAKLAIILASVVSGILGYMVIFRAVRGRPAVAGGEVHEAP